MTPLPCSTKDFRDLCYLMMDKVGKVKNNELKEIGSIGELRKVVNDPDDTAMHDIGMKVRPGCPPACVPVSLFRTFSG